MADASLGCGGGELLVETREALFHAAGDLELIHPRN